MITKDHSNSLQLTSLTSMGNKFYLLLANTAKCNLSRQWRLSQLQIALITSKHPRMPVHKQCQIFYVIWFPQFCHWVHSYPTQDTHNFKWFHWTNGSNNKKYYGKSKTKMDYQMAIPCWKATPLDSHLQEPYRPQTWDTFNLWSQGIRQSSPISSSYGCTDPTASVNTPTSHSSTCTAHATVNTKWTNARPTTNTIGPS